MLLNVTQQQRDTMLAALRYWQDRAIITRGGHEQFSSAINMDLQEVATNGGQNEWHTLHEIDELCEGINGGDLVITTAEQLEGILP